MSQNGISTNVQPSGGGSVGSVTIRLITTLFASITAQLAICPPYATATQRHLVVAVFHTNPTSKRFVDTVVVGKVAVDDSKEAPHVIALAAVPTI